MNINLRGLTLIFSIGTLVLSLFILDKKETRKKYKLMTSQERQELILKKMKAKGIEVGSGVPNKKYDNEEVYECCFQKLLELKLYTLQ